MPQLRAIQVHHGLAHIDRNMTGRHCSHIAHQRQIQVAALRVPQGAGDQGNRGLCGTERHAQRPLGGGAGHAGQGGGLCHKGRVQKGGFCGAAAAGGAQVQVGGQHLVQPIHHRAAKARHHHRQRHGQAQRGDHATHGDRCTLPHSPGALHRQQGQQVAREQWRDAVQHHAHGGRQAQDAAQQQGGHAQVGGQRHVPHRRQQRQYAACTHEGQAPAGGVATGVRMAQALKGLGGGELLGQPGRAPSPQECRSGTESAKNHRGHRAPLQRRCCTAEIASAQVAAQQPQGQSRQAGAQRQA